MRTASRRQLEALAGLMEMEADFLEACLSCGAVADDDLDEAPAGPPPTGISLNFDFKDVSDG